MAPPAALARASCTAAALLADRLRLGRRSANQPQSLLHLEGFMRSHSLRTLGLFVVCCLVLTAPPAHATGMASAGVALGFARVKLDDGTVSAFGGKGTIQVTTGPTGTGLIVFFNGKYPKNISRELVVAQATAEGDDAGQFAVANAIVASATRDQISVTVNAWTSDTKAAVNGYVFVVLYAGVAPKN
jgi:hypothetical protein